MKYYNENNEKISRKEFIEQLDYLIETLKEFKKEIENNDSYEALKVIENHLSLDGLINTINKNL